jgi:acyl carrier protein
VETVEELCTLIRTSITWADNEIPLDITPDTELLAAGLLDSLTIRRIVANLADEAGIAIPKSQVVAANFRSPDDLWRLVREVRDASEPAAG